MADKQMKSILVTGAVGFVGWKTCEFLLTRPKLIPRAFLRSVGLKSKHSRALPIVGLDNMNDYYDVRLKQWRLNQLLPHKNFRFYKIDIENRNALRRLFRKHRFAAVINLAARAGVRYSMENPYVYYTTNVLGTLNLLEACKEFGVKKFILASTSSLYAGQKMPFKEDLPVNEPISPYAASKKAAEVTCYTYHKLYGTDVTILRYFTVYGPAGRPDMSIFRFIYWIDQGKPIIIYGDGKQSRDFTYVDDIARGTIAALKPLGFEIINLGSDNPHKLNEALRIIEKDIGKRAKIKYAPFHPADLTATRADIHKARRFLNWRPNIPIKEGLRCSTVWFNENEDWIKSIKPDLRM